MPVLPTGSFVKFTHLLIPLTCAVLGSTHLTAQSLTWTIETETTTSIGTLSEQSRPAGLLPFLSFQNPTTACLASHTGTFVYDVTYDNTGTTPVTFDVWGSSANGLAIWGGTGPSHWNCWNTGDPDLGLYSLEPNVTIPAGGSHRTTGTLAVPGGLSGLTSVNRVAGQTCTTDGLHGGTPTAWPNGLGLQINAPGVVSTVHTSYVEHNVTIRTDYELPSVAGFSGCTPNATNSSGNFGQLDAFGSASVDTGFMVLVATQLPAGQAGYWLFSDTPSTGVPLGLGLGTLCLGGQIHRWHASLSFASPSGQIEYSFEPSEVPILGGVTAGSTMHFQLWHRDLVGGAPNSNTTNEIPVLFQ